MHDFSWYPCSHSAETTIQRLRMTMLGRAFCTRKRPHAHTPHHAHVPTCTRARAHSPHTPTHTHTHTHTHGDRPGCPPRGRSRKGNRDSRSSRRRQRSARASTRARWWAASRRRSGSASRGRCRPTRARSHAYPCAAPCKSFSPFPLKTHCASAPHARPGPARTRMHAWRPMACSMGRAWAPNGLGAAHSPPDPSRRAY